MVNKIKKYIQDEQFRFLINASHGLYRFVPDKEYIEKMYYVRMGKVLDLENPVTFNEKLQWLKLYDRNPVYSSMVDKYEAKKYVSKIIGEEYIISTIGVWDTVNEIPFDDLPEKFVLKCTHNSGGVIICDDKSLLDINETKRKMNKCLKNDLYISRREWPYKNVKPRIIAEKYMIDHKSNELRDYKFFCFNGKVMCYKVDFDRFTNHHANYYNSESELIDIGECVCPPDVSKHIEKPKSIQQMMEFAEILSKGIPFLRVDFYEVDGHPYFGELTFFPASGFGPFIYEGNDELLGSWLKLPICIK